MARPPRTAVATALVALAAGGALTGCARTVKASDVEAKITRNLERQMPSRAIGVDCPDGRDARKGTTFTCAVRIDGAPAVADVRLLSDDAFSFLIHRPR